MAIPARRPSQSSPEPESLFVSAGDGLRLHVRAFGPRLASKLPVICLPGLSRNGGEFDALAYGLSGRAGDERRVLTLDYRGRGRSQHDRDPANYNLMVELDDVATTITALAAMPAVFVGTSRGGILTMLLAAARPAMIAGAVLNDIGPVIEPQGLMRIKSYVGKMPQPGNMQEGAAILRQLFGGQFPRLTEAAWLAAAGRAWREENGRLVPSYDPALARSLDAIDPEQPPPPLWAQFDALAGVPVMAIRGANSDILSAKTLTAMKKRRKDLEILEVPDQGHTPLLVEPGVIGRIAQFVARCDRAPRPH